MQNSACGSAGGDQMMAVIASDQGSMRKNQSRIVSRLVSLLGHGVRWSSALNRECVGPLVQEIVVTSGIAGVERRGFPCQVQRNEGSKCEKQYYFLQSIQHTQNKTAKRHRDKIQELIVFFIEQTSDTMINSTKKELLEWMPANQSLVQNIMSFVT